jgi:hypothetical protein
MAKYPQNSIVTTTIVKKARGKRLRMRTRSLPVGASSSDVTSGEGFELTTLVVIGTDYIGSCKSNYHTIMTTTAPTIFKYGKLIGYVHVGQAISFFYSKWAFFQLYHGENKLYFYEMMMMFHFVLD